MIVAISFSKLINLLLNTHSTLIPNAGGGVRGYTHLILSTSFILTNKMKQKTKIKTIEQITEEEAIKLVKDKQARYHEFGYAQQHYLILEDTKDIYHRNQKGKYYERIGKF